MKNKNNAFMLFAVGALSLILVSFISCKDDSETIVIEEDLVEVKDTIPWTQEQVFKASDSLEVRADLYMKHDRKAPFIVLFHQAGWSRGEYAEIAPKLNDLGFNCMAVDQRSGGTVNGVDNITAKNASVAGVGTDFPDAMKDMLAAIEYAKENFSEGKFIMWGSSYSAALVLKLFGDDQSLADKALAFSPGEYFERFGKPSDWIGSSAKNIEKPVFITSAQSEKDVWWGIYQGIPAKDKANFVPSTTGNHGSRALWNQFSDSKDYWNAVEAFLQ
jgi:alpha-beta hydrolase superfamily lysophospholipase